MPTVLLKWGYRPMEIGIGLLTFLMLFPLLFVGVLILIMNLGKLSDKLNLWFRKSRCVKVNFLTLSGRNIEKFVVPDSRGLMHINKGTYVFNKDYSVTNARYSIPEVSVYESQVAPPSPDIVEMSVETEVHVPNGDGTDSIQLKKVPVHVVSFRRMSPQKLNGKTAQEVEGLLNAKIVDDIVNASSKQMQKLEMMFYLVLGLYALGLLTAFILYGNINDLRVEFARGL